MRTFWALGYLAGWFALLYLFLMAMPLLVGP
jgi:hypothetical protein